jgi:serine/threonine protein kinase
MRKRVSVYQLEEEIGRGMYGIVYRGTHIPSGQAIAVKMINRASLTSESKTYFDQEIKVMNALRNENIVTLYDVQKTDRNFYMIMEY